MSDTTVTLSLKEFDDMREKIKDYEYQLNRLGKRIKKVTGMTAKELNEKCDQIENSEAEYTIMNLGMAKFK